MNDIEKKYNKQLKKDIRKVFGLKRKHLKYKSYLTILLEQNDRDIRNILDKLQQDFAKQVGIDKEFLFGKSRSDLNE